MLSNISDISNDDTVTNFCESHSRSPYHCVRDVTGTNRTDQTDKTVIYGNGTNYYNYVRNGTDPTQPIPYRLKDELLNEANFAPWEWMINYDANRYGVWFIALSRSLIQFRLS